MAIKDIESNINVLEAAKERIKNIFNTGLEMKLSMSGGKDSICLCNLVYKLIQEGKIKSSQLTVQFIDEEAMFDDVIEIVIEWRKKFLMLGAKFEWYCIEVLHYNCLNTLDDSEDWTLWDSKIKKKWVRDMPSFAITDHPLLKKRKDTYQDFLKRLNKGSITIIGVRTSESIQRRTNIAILNSNTKNKSGINKDGLFFPIYDWSNSDVWLYIKENKLNFPKTYMDLYQIGLGKQDMRISQFFSIDTAKSLTKLSEFAPGLMDRIINREPNAYLTALYWESEMFRRAKREKTDEKEKVRDYKKEVLEILKDINKNFATVGMRKNAEIIKDIVLKYSERMEKNHFKDCFLALIAGDPKGRIKRSIIKSINWDFVTKQKKERR